MRIKNNKLYRKYKGTNYEVETSLLPLEILGVLVALIFLLSGCSREEEEIIDTTYTSNKVDLILECFENACKENEKFYGENVICYHESWSCGGGNGCICERQIITPIAMNGVETTSTEISRFNLNQETRDKCNQ